MALVMHFWFQFTWSACVGMMYAVSNGSGMGNDSRVALKKGRGKNQPSSVTMVPPSVLHTHIHTLSKAERSGSANPPPPPPWAPQAHLIGSAAITAVAMGSSKRKLAYDTAGRCPPVRTVISRCPTPGGIQKVMDSWLHETTLPPAISPSPRKDSMPSHVKSGPKKGRDGHAEKMHDTPAAA